MLAAISVVSCAGLFVLFAAFWMLSQHHRRKSARRSGRDLVISRMSGVALGAMLLSFQQFYQPEVRHLLAEEEREDALADDDEGAEPPGGRVFHEQLRQIRAGCDVEALTVQMPGNQPGKS
ncbi:MAG TPA: hypothetical protein VJS11_12525 [Acidobacteriaceae bacterium]|nr:hypothetical protein [Acidobacteriaceae bacterium]